MAFQNKKQNKNKHYSLDSIVESIGRELAHRAHAAIARGIS
jgi:hypothetical protein